MKAAKALFQEWKQRLAHSDRYWQRQGLSTDPPEPGIPHAFQYIDWYRGNQWGRGGWGGFFPEDLITVNVTFANTNAMSSKLSKRNPEVIVTPKRKGGEESRRARVNQLVMNYFLKELKMKRQVDRALLDGLVTPFGCVRHIYTPHLEKYDAEGNELDGYSMARPDLPGIRRYPFWDVRFDPLADDWFPDGTNNWVAFRDLLSMDQVASHPRLTKRKDLKATKSIDLLSKEMRGNPMKESSPDWDKLVEVWWVYEKRTRKFFALSPGSEDFLQEPDDWQIPWESLPYSYLCFNPQVDSNVGIPFPSTYASQQMELNKVETMMAELVKRTRRLVFAQRGAFSDTDQTKISGGNLPLQELFLVDQAVGDCLKEVAIGGFDQTLMLYRAAIKEDIREQIGLSQMDRGQRLNAPSASEAVAVQTGSDTQSSRPEQVFEDFWVDICRTFHQSLRYTLADEVLVPIVSLNDRAMLKTTDEYMTVSREDVNGEFKVDIRVGSTLPKNHQVDFAKALQLKTIFAQDSTVDQIELSRVVIEESEFDSATLMKTPEQVQGTEAILAAKGVTEPAKGGKNGQAGAGLDANFMRQLAPGATQ